MRSHQSTAELVQRPRLVLADDDAIARLPVRHQLQDAFDCVGEGADADEAIALVQSEPPDIVILLDVDMPGGGALRATCEIADRSPRTDGRVVRVAIADDDAIARYAIEAMIEGCHGLAVVGAAAGVEDIVLVAALKGADVVVLDWMMPDGGGAEAARRILLRSPDTGIVALTSSDSRAAAVEMRRAGAFRTARKGGSAEDLGEMIRGALAAAA